MEFGAADEVEIILAPLGAPVGMIESGALDFSVVVGEVNDELIGAGREGLQQFFVGIEPLGFRHAREDFHHAIENDDVRIEVEGRKIDGTSVGVMQEKHGQFVGLSRGQVNLGEIRSADDSAHVGVKMREVDAGGFGFVHLGMGFDFDVGHFGVGVHVFGGEREIAIGIEKA